MKSKELVIGKQVVVQLVKRVWTGNIHLLLGLILMPLKTIILVNTLAKPMKFDLSNFMLKSCGFSFFSGLFTSFRARKEFLRLPKKEKNNLQNSHILRTLFANNTPQASNQFRLITAQTEGLLVSGGLK